MRQSAVLTDSKTVREVRRAFRQWEKLLESISKKIHDLNGSTEDEFLSIGSRLQEFYFRADEMSKVSSSSAGLMCGEEVSSAILGLEGMSERIKEYLLILEKESKESEDSLRNIHNILNSIYEPMDGFRKIINILSLLGISTRIENAHLRHSDVGFTSLSDDIKELAVMIDNRSSGILEQSDILSHLIKENISRITALELSQREQIKKILEDTRDSMESLGYMNQKSFDAVSQISSQSDKISSNIGGAVQSVQFHDITRQQIEHVKTALDEIILMLREKSTEIEDVEKLMELVCLVGDIAELEKSQLDNSRNEFIKAVDSIIRNLRDISANIMQIKEKTLELSGKSDNIESSVLSEIEDGMGSVTASLQANACANREFSAVILSLGKTVAELSVFIRDIEQIASEIELIALNARVKAAHTGEEGAGLGVLAEAIQKLSLDARQRATSVSQILSRIGSSADALCENINEQTNERDLRVEEMVQELEILLSSLRGVKGKSQGLLQRLTLEGKTLAEDIESAVSTITVHQKVDKALKELIKDIGEIVSHSRRINPSSSLSERQDVLEELSKRYTMKSERNIHINFNRSMTDLVPPQESPMTESDGGGDDWDNVELF